MSRIGDRLLTIAVFIAVWWGFVTLTDQPAYVLPGPDKVFQAFIKHRELLTEHTLITLQTLVIGFALGVFAGTLTAIQLLMSRGARRWLMPLMIFAQAVPLIALAPVLTLWMGYGTATKLVMTVLVIYFPLTLVFYDGLRRTDPGLLDLAQTMRATSNLTLLRLRLPAALPALASGMKLAAIYAPIAVWIGEWVSASKGLGYLMLYANGRLKVDLMFAALIVLASFALLFHALIAQIAARMTRWSPEQDG